jgi:hypothetical protein
LRALNIIEPRESFDNRVAASRTGEIMAANRKFGIVMVILGGILLWYVSTGLLLPAPLLLVFGTAGALGAVGLGIWSLLGKY